MAPGPAPKIANDWETVPSEKADAGDWETVTDWEPVDTKTPAAAAPRPGALQRFGSSAAAPIKGAVKGAYHALIDAPQPGVEQSMQSAVPSVDVRPVLAAKRVLVDPQVEQAKQAYELFKQGRLSEAAGHGLAAALPVLGPWAAQFGETEGKQLGAGDYAGAAGTLAGNAALALAPGALKKAGKLAGSTVDAVTGTGPGVIKDLTAKTMADNLAEVKRAGEARKATLAANKAADEQTLLARGEVDEHNAGLADKTAAGQTEAEQINAQVARRAAAQKELENVSDQMDVAVEKARHDALAEGNKKYSGVNEALNGIESDPDVMSSALGDASQALNGSVHDTTLLKKMEAEYLPEIDEKTGEPKKGKEGRTPNYEDLQADYSRLGRELSKGTLPGDVYHAYDQLHESIGDEMQRIADEAGQGADLKDAREYWRRMKQTFGKSSDTVNNRAAKAVNAANPKILKRQANEYQIRLLSSFDPEIGKMAEKAGALRQELSSLPKKESTAAPVVRKDYAEPNPTNPIEPAATKTISSADVQAAKEQALKKRAAWIGHRAAWAAASPFFYILHDLVRGDVGGVAPAVASGAAILGGSQLLSRALEAPAIVKFLTKATEKDTAAIPPELRGDLPRIVSSAKAKGIKVSPALMKAAQGSIFMAPKQHPSDQWQQPR